MALLSEYTTVYISGKNQKHFESLGYEIPKYYNKNNSRYMVKSGTYITVKTSDLLTGSNIKVHVSCDRCGREYDLPYYKYLHSLHDGKNYCCNCFHKVLISGKNHYLWNPHLTDEDRIRLREYPEYIDFVKRTLARDDYTCKCCGIQGNKLEVHHLNGYNWYKEGRVDETNAISLCKTCHKSFHSFYGYGNNTKEQFEEWIGFAVGELKKYNNKIPMAKRVYCAEDNVVYETVQQFCDAHNIPRVASVYKVCNHQAEKRMSYDKNGNEKIHCSHARTIRSLHVIWYDEYLSMNDTEKTSWLYDFDTKGRKMVICTTTNEVFNTITECAHVFRISPMVISQCCNGDKDFHRRRMDKLVLRFMYYKDYLNQQNYNA